MLAPRSGSSLIEVLFALVLVTLATSWALQATTTTERAIGSASTRRDAMLRAEQALADVQALPCDSTSASLSAREARWLVTATRVTDPPHRYDRSIVTTRRGDTISIARHRWCGQ